MALMRSESGLNPAAVNPGTRATGLIRFMPSMARSLGISVEALRGMTAAQQMPYVEKYFDSVRLPQGASGGRIYASIFLPGRANRDVLTQAGEPYYDQNRGLDVDRDGRITISDLDAKIARHGGSSSAALTPQQGAGEQLNQSSSSLAIAEQNQRMGGQTVAANIPSRSPAPQQTNTAPINNNTGETSLNSRLRKLVAA